MLLCTYFVLYWIFGLLNQTMLNLGSSFGPHCFALVSGFRAEDFNVVLISVRGRFNG